MNTLQVKDGKALSHRWESIEGNATTVTIFTYDVKSLHTSRIQPARKTLEAMWILARDPEMNSRNEQMSITNDLMPLLSLCGL